MSISYRLKKIAGYVTPGNIVADIGTDHGYVPIFLVREGLVPRAIAVDTSAGSLEKARENAIHSRVSDLVDFRLSDGLSGIEPGEVQTIIISGMGGILMHRILLEGIDVVAACRELILSPHRDPELIEQFLLEHNFAIAVNETIEDKKKKYRILKGVRGL